jgi:hypothetical protein
MMTISNPPKALIALVGLICLTLLTLTACSDRVRHNCQTTDTANKSFMESKCP